MQPLGGSKELLPLGHQPTAEAAGRLRAISEYLVERMLLGGADRICFVVSSEKSDLLRFYARSEYAARLFFVVQPHPAGLCDAVFRAVPFITAEETVLIGLPDTVWYPRDGYQRAGRDQVHLITFPVSDPEEFDAVIPAVGTENPARSEGRVARIEVKSPAGRSHRIWGAITAPGAAVLGLAELWRQRGCQDQYLGHLLNAWIEAGHTVSYDCTGTHYRDIGTPAGYVRALEERVWEEQAWERRATA